MDMKTKIKHKCCNRIYYLQNVNSWELKDSISWIKILMTNGKKIQCDWQVTQGVNTKVAGIGCWFTQNSLSISLDFSCFLADSGKAVTFWSKGLMPRALLFCVQEEKSKSLTDPRADETKPQQTPTAPTTRFVNVRGKSAPICQFSFLFLAEDTSRYCQ